MTATGLDPEAVWNEPIVRGLKKNRVWRGWIFRACLVLPKNRVSLRNDIISRYRRNLQNRNSAAAGIAIRFGPNIL
eukprot:COSAG01_NODE_66231_length_270_cov_17.578947_1_plen_75_part_10